MLTAQNDSISSSRVVVPPVGVVSPVGASPPVGVEPANMGSAADVEPVINAEPAIGAGPVLQAQFIPTNSFLDILFQKKQLTLEQIEELRRAGLSSGQSYEAIIKEKKLLDETALNQAKAEYNHLGYIDLTSVGIDPEALGLLDDSIAKRYKVLPFALDNEHNLIKVAMLNPLDLTAIEFLKQKTGRNVEAYYADTEVLERLIVERYSQNLSTEVDEALRTTNQYQNKIAQGVAINNSGQILRDAPINRIVENILDFAITSRASDVHIEPQGNNIRVRYRVDGILAEKLILPKSVHEAVISRIKIMSNLKIDEKRLPQDGRFTYVSSGKEIDLRVSTLPTVHGEKIVMRLLEKNAAVPSLQDLGLNGLALRRVLKSIKIPQGIILITGPTGSGKTTTLYSILHMINNVGVNIMTLEDPVEYQIPGISQVQTNPKAGLTFASGMRSFLRQDPDIIMVGEIRDNETADLALQASLTGHLVFSTLHTNSAAGALPRLFDMGAEPFLLSSTMLLTLGQRVVRRINPKYKEEYKPEPALVDNIKQVLGPLYLAFCKKNNKDPDNITLFRPAKERPNGEPEYKGRIAIFEVMEITAEISQLIMKRSPESELEAMALKQGMMLMKQDGYIKALEGITTVEEVLRVAEVK
ncbi:MAG TPA: GspE/PulE family protein [Candidatus Woesebacteria bacterium]|nr:GspE/PulE family protein [Candidatus Woesebacteria bacterium]